MTNNILLLLFAFLFMVRELHSPVPLSAAASFPATPTHKLYNNILALFV